MLSNVQRAKIVEDRLGWKLTERDFASEGQGLLSRLLQELPKTFRYSYELTSMNDQIHKAAVWRIGERGRTEVCNESPLLALIDAYIAVGQNSHAEAVPR